MRYLTAGLITAALVFGCVEVRPIQGLNSAQIANQTEVARDKSAQITEVEALKLVFGEFNENHYLLKAARTDGDPAVHYTLFMRTLRKLSLGGIGWKAAADLQGTSFPLVTESVETNEDLLYESVTFELPRAWLNAAALSENRIRVTGAITNQVLLFPTNYVSGFLSRVDQEFARRP